MSGFKEREMMGRVEWRITNKVRERRGLLRTCLQLLIIDRFKMPEHTRGPKDKMQKNSLCWRGPPTEYTDCIYRNKNIPVLTGIWPYSDYACTIQLQ